MRLLVSDLRDAAPAALAPWQAGRYRIFSRVASAYWRNAGCGYCHGPEEAGVFSLEGALDVIGSPSDADKGLELEVIDSPSQNPASFALPSSPYQMPQNTGGSTRTPGRTRCMVGILEVTDLLSGSEDKSYILIEACDYSGEDGVRSNTLWWHGPFPTRSAASAFSARLAALKPTGPGGASAGQKAGSCG